MKILYLNETSNKLLERAKTLLQKKFMSYVRYEIVTDYSYIHVNFLFVVCTNALRIVNLPCVTTDLCTILVRMNVYCRLLGLH